MNTSFIVGVFLFISIIPTWSIIPFINWLIVNSSFKVANASAYCIDGYGGAGGSTWKYANNSFEGSTTPVNTANISQGIVNTSDSQGNILI